METRKMTVHEGLSKIKTSDSRIQKLLNAEFIGVAKKSADKISGVPVEEYKKNLCGSLDKITDIIKETNAIKAAISKSNAETVVNVAGVEMTVAEAIYLWKHGLHIQKRLLAEMQDQYSAALVTIEERNGNDLDKRADQFVASIYGSKEKVDSKDVDDVVKKFKEQNSWIMIDPNKLWEKIQKMESEIADFESAVDSAIQMSNATTVIEFTV